MPNPKSLKVGDRIRFVSLPDEWAEPGYVIDDDDIEFMNVIIARKLPSRIARIDEHGTPWVEIRLRVGTNVEFHSWGILEQTGWRVVKPRV